MKLSIIFLVLSSHLIAFSLAAPILPILNGVAGIVSPAGADSPGNPVGYPGGYPGAYPNDYPSGYPGGPPVAPGSTQALYNNHAVASGTQGLLNKIAFGVLRN